MKPNDFFSPIHSWARLTSAEKKQLLQRPMIERQSEISARVKEILQSVREEGDASLFRWTKELDQVSLTVLEVTKEERRAAHALVSSEARQALERAKAQIERFHSAQVPKEVEVEVSSGCVCRRVPRPLQRVGLYIPGGTAPLPSTVLMLGVPSALAGCPLRVLCTPPRKDGTIDPPILVAADLCGVDSIFKVGGAQAIAAMAYGTDQVKKVDKIFGPGNAWVTEAKLQVSTDPGGATIDMPAGPSEVLVIADRGASPAFVAADLLSQAEHGMDSQVVLLSEDRTLLESALLAVKEQLAVLPRREIAQMALSHSRFILVSDLKMALEVSNAYAPEHLILQVEEPEKWSAEVLNAGSVFLGRWSPEALGDYASGTNHVLPTYGLARSLSGVSVESFMKQITFQQLTKEALADLGPVVETLAALEGLHAHRNAVSLRLRAIRQEEGESARD
jgi:histidinol dehydrogenase